LVRRLRLRTRTRHGGEASRKEEEMSEPAEANRAAMQQLTREAQANALRNMKDYLASRQKTYDVFNRLEPNSKQTRDAKALLERARREYEDYAGLKRICGLVLSKGAEFLRPGCGTG
jgi:hypothetical protein